MRELYNRFLKTWICFANPWIRFANPWIRFVSWIQIMTPKRFDWYHDCWIPLHRFANLDLEVRSLKIRIFSRILKNLNYMDYLKQTQICTNPRLQIPKSILFSKDLYRGFILSYRVQKICCVNLIPPTVFKRFV